jgi:hypothetical protein
MYGLCSSVVFIEQVRFDFNQSEQKPEQISLLTARALGISSLKVVSLTEIN